MRARLVVGTSLLGWVIAGCGASSTAPEETVQSQSAALVATQAGPPRPSFDGPVDSLSLTPAEVKAAIYVGNATTRVAKLERSGVRIIAEMKWVLDRFDRAPTASAKDTIQRIQRKRSYERGLDQAVAANTYVKLSPYRALLEAIQSIASADKTQTEWAASAVQFARTVTANDFGGPTDLLNLESEVDASAAGYRALANRAEIHGLIQSLYDRATTPGNSELLTVVDELFGSSLRAQVSDSYQKILEANPDSGSLPLLKQYLTGSTGGLALSTADMTRELDTQYASLSSLFDDQYDYLVAARALGRVGDDPPDATLADMITKYKELKKKSDERLEAIKVSMETISKLLKLKDPAAAEKLAAVGEASIGIAAAITTFAGSIATGGVATPIATVNLLSKLVLGVAGIVKALKKPSKDVPTTVTPLQYLEKLHGEMQARFDRVDAKLDLIFDTLELRFGQINWQLMEIGEDVDTVLRELFQFHQELARLNQNFYAFLADGFRRPLIEGVNGGIGYTARTSVAMPYQPDYVGYENLFNSWATIHAADELQAGAATRSYQDSTLGQELSSYPLFTNVNFLSQYPSQRLSLPALSGARVVNLTDWAASARAYLDLAYENPAYDDNIAPARIAQLIRRGTELRSALARIAKVDAASSPVKSELFTRLLAYSAALNTSLQQQIQAEQARFLDGKAKNRIFPASLNPWGGPQQSTALVPAPLASGTMAPCTTALPSISQPNGLMAVIPKPLLVKEVIKLQNTTSSSFRVCYDAQWVDSEYYPIDPTTQGRRSRLQATVRLYFENQQLSAKTKKFPSLVQEWSRGLNARPDVSPYSYLGANWVGGINLRSTFDGAGPFTADGTITTTAENWVRNEFAKLQRDLYANIVDQLQTAGPIGDAGRAIDGNKALIGAYATLGLPNALRNYDELRALLFGTGYSIADSAYYRTVYSNPAQDLSTNPLTIVTDGSATLRNQLGDALKVVFDALQTGELQERNDLLENTLQELRTRQATKLDRLAPTVTESHGVLSGQAQNSFKNPTFSWTLPSNAAGHELYFGSDPEGRAANVAYPVGGVYTYSPAPTGVTAAVSFLRMRIRDTENNWGTWQTLFTFVYNPQCPVAGSSFDGTMCLVGSAPPGTEPFLRTNNLYHSPAAPGTNCPAPGSTLVDGECYVTTVPTGTTPFAWGPSQPTGLYYTPLSGNLCPLTGSYFDGANCFVASVPNGSYGIARDGKLFYAAMPQRCPLTGSVFDGANCFVATPPAGTTPIVMNRSLGYTPLMGP